jgi:glycosyltransferase involved in cell wall biosynthesis
MTNLPCRIAFGITELDPGGAERMLTELATRMDRSEWEPRVYCLGPDAHYARVLRERQVPVTCFSGRGVISAPRVIRQWTRELRRFRPQILYTFLFHANLLGRISGRLAAVPHVLSGHRVAERRTAWHGRLDRWTNFLVERNVCVSRGVAEFIERSVGLDPEKTVVIPNAVDVEPFAQAQPADLTPLGIPPNSRVLITIGRVERQKGIDVLLAAVPSVISRFADAHFLVVGDGPDRANLMRYAQSLGVADRVHWAGRRNDVPELLKTATALVLPSRWEGMPNVVLEAMAAGKPIVATDVEGVRELVSPDLNGWLVPSESPQLLGDALCKLLSDPEQGLRMGLASQRICMQSFTIDRFVASHVRLFREIAWRDRLVPN